MHSLALFSRLLLMAGLGLTLQAAAGDREAMIERELEGRNRVSREIASPVAPPVGEHLSRLYDSLALHEARLGHFSAARAAIAEAEKRGVDDALLHLTANLVHLYAKDWDGSAASLVMADTRLAEARRQAAELPGPEFDHAWSAYLIDRSEWSLNHVYLELARGRAKRAARWSETGCDYQRMLALHTLSRLGKAPPQTPARWLDLDRRVLAADARVSRLREAVPCANDGYESLYVMVSRARAGQFPGVEGWRERYPASDAMYGRLVDLFVDGRALDTLELERLAAEGETDRAEILDRLCEAHYFSGMYYRYVKQDEVEALRRFRLALDTGSIASIQYHQAGFELERSPAP